ncbi:hypothetical protein DXA13_02950 [Clostridium sp. AM58-1XD]|nr:hypothetical protein DXA13_02950 [Clostridium sp. AM58-1XD]
MDTLQKQHKSLWRENMAEQFTIYATMKKMGKQKKESLVPVPFVLEKKPETSCSGAFCAGKKA